MLTDTAALTYRRAAYKEARKWLSHDDAEDIAGECLIKLYQALERSEITALTTYITRTAHNLVIDNWRRMARMPVCSLHSPGNVELSREGNSPCDTLMDLLVDTQGSAELPCLRREQGERVRAAVAQLSEEHRLVLFLHYAVGLEIETIARLTGVAVGTVKSRLFRAREQVGRRLRSYVEVE